MTETIRIRPATDADREAVTRIFDAANPAWATSAAEYRRGPKPPPSNGIMLLAELDGDPVGAARANEALDGLIPRPGTFSARIAVLPSAEKRGVGGRLWNVIREWLEPQSAQEVNSWADHDSRRSVGVAAGWGFQRRPGSIEEPADLADDQPWAWDYELRLDLERTGQELTCGAIPQGVSLSPLEKVLDDPALSTSLHEAHEECRGDVPAWETYEATGLSDFLTAQRERLAAGGAGIVAHRNCEVLAATFADRAAFVPMVHNDFTMVRRHARGQHLAVAVKSRLLRDVARTGIERVTTEVRTDNHPMLAVNRTLGFRRIAMRQLSRNGIGQAQSSFPR